jgi:dTDP-6-deoxy-L-talose 4-dehydrogenase (NAD+)
MNSKISDLRSSYAGVRALVFGASGFIGRRVAQALAESGAIVYPVVRCRTAAALSAASYPAVHEVPGFDLRNEAAVQALFAEIKPSITFNLAGYGVDPAERDAEVAYALNAMVPGMLCRAARAWSNGNWQGQRLVHTGSALEYGAADGDLAESCTPQPGTLYGRSKLEGTLNVTSEAARTGLRACTARLFMVYGPGERPHRLLPSLLRVARTGETLELSEGTQRRDFTYLDDAVESLLRLGASSARPGEVINVATGTLTSVRAFAEKAARVLALSEEQLRFGVLPQRAEEMSHEPVNILRLRQLTSWTPHILPDEGIRLTAMRTHSGTEEIE